MSAAHIAPVDRRDIPAAIDFVMRARAEVFPMLASAGMPEDLKHFEQTYSEARGGQFLLARQDDAIVAAIGYLAYDGRFAQLDYGSQRVVEVVRLFVNPLARRSGLATTIYQALKAHAQAQGVNVLYLHTHPFLPGAIVFWQRQGFSVVDVEDDPVWQTTHMECRL